MEQVLMFAGAPNSIQWKQRNQSIDPYWLGFIPQWLDENNPEPAAKQFDNNYQHGGGWHAFGKDKYTMNAAGDIKYPGDPYNKWLFEGQFRDEVIRVHEHEFVSITQPDGTFEVCRMD